MSVSVFSKFYKIKETQTTIDTDSAMLALPSGTVIQKLTGEEYTKVSTNVFDKVNRDIYSQAESDSKYAKLDYENTFSDSARFNKDVDVKQTLSANTVQVSGATQLHELSATDITANNLTLTNLITSPNAGISSIQSDQVLPTANRTGTLGSSTRVWNTAHINEMYGTAQHARYSDLAEKYETDQDYECGVVLEVSENGKLTTFKGGSLAGVVSTKPGLKINSDGVGQYVCLKGMVPVKCLTPIKAGQYCIAKDGKVYGVDKDKLTWKLSLDIVGVALKDSDGDMVMVKV